MCLTEVVVGIAAGSTGLIADSLDTLADASVCAISLYAVGRAVHIRRGAATDSGVPQLILGVSVLIEAARRFISGGDLSIIFLAGAPSSFEPHARQANGALGQGKGRWFGHSPEGQRRGCGGMGGHWPNHATIIRWLSVERQVWLYCPSPQLPLLSPIGNGSDRSQVSLGHWVPSAFHAR